MSSPDVADLQVDQEPQYPIEALQDTEEGRKAEEAWNNAILLWGRTHHDRLARVCGYFRDLKVALPTGHCS